ncbi:MAG: biotin--[acetyl-CoA-carboxylase] ligase [Pseudomonadota bacterium]
MDEVADADQLREVLAPLLEHGRAKLSALKLPPAQLAELGFAVSGDEVSIPAGLERLNSETIRARMSARAEGWLTDFAVLEAVGSTNTMLSDLAGQRSIHGTARLAELQLQGRGRRGRGWFSPYGNNLALSLGARLPFSVDQLGGFSLAVGLAVADALQRLGVGGIALKWPNDVLLDGRKISGILIELHGGREATEVVIGIGINFRLPEAARTLIDQPVTDLTEQGFALSRNETAAALLSSLVDFIDGFSVEGFEPMREAFDALHYYHGERCAILLGEERLEGMVLGVTTAGELRLAIDGEERVFSSGEVSLRAL